MLRPISFASRLIRRGYSAHPHQPPRQIWIQSASCRTSVVAMASEEQAAQTAAKEK